MDFVPVMERIAAWRDVIDFAALGHQFPDIVVFVRAAVKIRYAGILAAAALFDGGACINGCRLVFLSGAVLSVLHLSGSLAAFNNVLQKNGRCDGSDSAGYGCYGISDLSCYIVINVSAKLAVLVNVHSDVDNGLACS